MRSYRSAALTPSVGVLSVLVLSQGGLSVVALASVVVEEDSSNDALVPKLKLTKLGSSPLSVTDKTPSPLPVTDPSSDRTDETDKTPSSPRAAGLMTMTSDGRP